MYCIPIDLSKQESSAVINRSEFITILMFYIQPVFGITCSRLVAGKIHQILTTIEAVDKQVKPARNRQLFMLKRIKILLDKLIGTIDLINHCFAIQILYCAGMCFIIGVFICFYLCRSLIHHQNVDLFMSIATLFWYFYYLFFILVFIAVGSRIASVSKRIGVHVHKAINCSRTSTVISNELLIFSQQLLHHSPVITCGLFVYDWSLFYTILGATATYLIILIQFDVSFPSLEDITGNGSMVIQKRR
ncbi:putative gustatory receptor 2a [Ochlerotatus camptorhynchus]|uniref:putative gustatory receptor 2a n=1 Tax=Ochlerotatus camptorhynchus TaxID=644619 RepID=UPI0031E1E023